MYTLISTPNIEAWTEANLQKYSVQPTNQHIKKQYKTSHHDGDFDLIIYNSRTITIAGTLKDRLYQKVISLVTENNFQGCDEVGVGDFFGPTVYCCVKFTQKTILLLQQQPLSIKDSKKMKDQDILAFFYNYSDKLDYQVQIIYDHEINNLNSIAQKVYYHHQNIDLELPAVIDLFTTEKSFYNYSKQLNITWPSNLLLETKADSKFYCVALASMIARAIFLQEIAKLEQKYNLPLPLGATNVKPTAFEFLKLHGEQELSKICKTSFKTYEQIIGDS